MIIGLYRLQFILNTNIGTKIKSSLLIKEFIYDLIFLSSTMDFYQFVKVDTAGHVGAWLVDWQRGD
jgi:hypothetical protein